MRRLDDLYATAPKRAPEPDRHTTRREIVRRYERFRAENASRAVQVATAGGDPRGGEPR